MSDKPISDYTDALEARLAELEAEVARRGEGVECHAARPGEGTYECSVHDGRKGCPACRLRTAEAEVARLEVSRLEATRIGYMAGHNETVESVYGDPEETAQDICKDLDDEAALTPPPAEQRMTVSTCFPCLGAGRNDLGGGISSQCAACHGTGLQGPPAAGDADE